jgi:hypothetical protein
MTTPYRLKTALVLISAPAVVGFWRVRPNPFGQAGRVTWPVLLVLAVFVLVLLWQWDVLSTKLFTSSKRLLHKVERTLSAPQRNPDGFYQGGQMVAQGEGMIGNIDSGTVTFQALSHVHRIDFNRPLEFRSWRLSCKMYGKDSAVTMGGEIMRIISDVRCTVLGRRPGGEQTPTIP